jgi:hypothetical protein
VPPCGLAQHRQLEPRQELRAARRLGHAQPPADLPPRPVASVHARRSVPPHGVVAHGAKRRFYERRPLGSTRAGAHPALNGLPVREGERRPERRLQPRPLQVGPGARSQPSAERQQVAAAQRRLDTSLLSLANGKIHRVDPDFGSTLTVSNRDSQSNCLVNWKIMGQPCEFQVHEVVAWFNL